MDLWMLFIIALMPVLKVLLVTAVGAFIALDRFDILRENARKPLNMMVFFVFCPALLYSSLAKTITLRSMGRSHLQLVLVYKIARIYACKSSDVDKVDDSIQRLQ